MYLIFVRVLNERANTHEDKTCLFKLVALSVYRYARHFSARMTAGWILRELSVYKHSAVTLDLNFLLSAS